MENPNTHLYTSEGFAETLQHEDRRANNSQVIERYYFRILNAQSEFAIAGNDDTMSLSLWKAKACLLSLFRIAWTLNKHSHQNAHTHKRCISPL